jgi:hypothetical protein
MYYLHPFTLRELELLRLASTPSHRPRRRARSAPWRRRIRGMLREHPELAVFAVDADEVTAQLAHGAR